MNEQYNMHVRKSHHVPPVPLVDMPCCLPVVVEVMTINDRCDICDSRVNESKLCASQHCMIRLATLVLSAENGFKVYRTGQSKPVTLKLVVGVSTTTKINYQGVESAVVQPSMAITKREANK